MERASDSISVTWDEIPDAAEYVIFDEVTKHDNRGYQTEPIYRGGDPEHTITGMDSGEPVRLRIIAIDDQERVLARSMIRTATKDSSTDNPELTWIADGTDIEYHVDGAERYLDEADDPIAPFSAPQDPQGESEEEHPDYDTRVHETDNGETLRLSVGDLDASEELSAAQPRTEEEADDLEDAPPHPQLGV